MGDASNMAISAECFVPDVGPISPGNVTRVNSTIVGLPRESFGTGRRNIFTVIRVVWSPPDTLGSGVTSYQVRAARQPIEINDTSVSNEAKVADNGKLSLQEEYSFNEVPAGIITLYVQVS